MEASKPSKYSGVEENNHLGVFEKIKFNILRNEQCNKSLLLRGTLSPTTTLFKAYMCLLNQILDNKIINIRSVNAFCIFIHVFKVCMLPRCSFTVAGFEDFLFTLVLTNQG